MDDLCYSVDVCNWFSLLTVETTSAEESSVEDFPTELGCAPIMKTTKSKDGPKKSVSSEDWGSPSSADQVATVHVVEKRQVGTKGHITHYSEENVTTGGHMITHSSHTEHGHSKGRVEAWCWTMDWMDGNIWSHPMI